MKKERTARRLLDFYPTASFLTEALLDKVKIEGPVYEPCSGQNHITDVLERAGAFVTTNDIDPNTPAAYHRDATEEKTWSYNRWTVTNPPFNCAFEILKHAVKFSSQGVAILVRLSFLEPTLARGPWLKANPPTKLIILPRFSFTQDGNTDSVTVCWAIWENGKPGCLDFVERIPKEKKEKK